jgi:hypothetical protein
MSLYSYKLTHDTGFAPNPFWSVLTLATCKPKMRLKRDKNDWIAGFTSSSLCGDRPGDERLIYLMHVDEKLTIAKYFEDERFADKISNPHSDQAVQRAGDNIYKPLRSDAIEPSDFEQLRNPHHWDGSSSCGVGDARKRDVNGGFVLIGRRFAYFGQDALHIPAEVRPTVPNGMSPYGAPTHDEERVQALVEYVFEQCKGKQVIGPPHDWPDGDDSWSH